MKTIHYWLTGAPGKTQAFSASYYLLSDYRESELGLACPPGIRYHGIVT